MSWAQGEAWARHLAAVCCETEDQLAASPKPTTLYCQGQPCLRTAVPLAACSHIQAADPANIHRSGPWPERVARLKSLPQPPQLGPAPAGLRPGLWRLAAAAAAHQSLLGGPLPSLQPLSSCFAGGPGPAESVCVSSAHPELCRQSQHWQSVTAAELDGQGSVEALDKLRMLMRAALGGSACNQVAHVIMQTLQLPGAVSPAPTMSPPSRCKLLHTGRQSISDEET